MWNAWTHSFHDNPLLLNKFLFFSKQVLIAPSFEPYNLQWKSKVRCNYPHFIYEKNEA